MQVGSFNSSLCCFSRSHHIRSGHDKTQKLVAEAQRCVSEVVFDPSMSTNMNGSRSSMPDVDNLASPLPPGMNADENPQSPRTPHTPSTPSRLISSLPKRSDSLKPSGLPISGSDEIPQSPSIPDPSLGLDGYTSPSSDGPQVILPPAPTQPPPTAPGQPPSNALGEFGVSEKRDRPGTMPASGNRNVSELLGDSKDRSRSLDGPGNHFSTLPPRARGRDSVSQYLLKEDPVANVQGDTFSADVANALARAAGTAS